MELEEEEQKEKDSNRHKIESKKCSPVLVSEEKKSLQE